MKSAFGGVGLFMIVIFFIVLFTGYICMSINHTRAFNVKNALIRIIERNGTGNKDMIKLSLSFADEVSDELTEIGYLNTNKCNDGWTGFSRDGLVLGEGASNAAFCLKKVSTTNATLNKAMYYYQIETFYQLDIPIVKTLMRLTIKGDTSPML